MESYNYNISITFLLEAFVARKMLNTALIIVNNANTKIAFILLIIRLNGSKRLAK